MEELRPTCIEHRSLVFNEWKRNAENKKSWRKWLLLPGHFQARLPLQVRPRSNVGKEPLQHAYMILVLLKAMKNLFLWLSCTHVHRLNTLTTIWSSKTQLFTLVPYFFLSSSLSSAACIFNSVATELGLSGTQGNLFFIFHINCVPSVTVPIRKLWKPVISLGQTVVAVNVFQNADYHTYFPSYCSEKRCIPPSPPIYRTFPNQLQIIFFQKTIKCPFYLCGFFFFTLYCFLNWTDKNIACGDKILYLLREAWRSYFIIINFVVSDASYHKRLDLE